MISDKKLIKKLTLNSAFTKYPEANNKWYYSQEDRWPLESENYKWKALKYHEPTK